MNRGKVVSGIVAFVIYLSIIFLILFFYNIHKTKAKNYVEKNSDRVTVTLVNSDKTVFNKSSKTSTPKKPVAVVTPPVVKKKVPKKVVPPKRVVPKKVVPKKEVRASRPIPVPKKHIPKKVVPKPPKKVVPKKKVPKKVIVKEPKKVVPKPPKKVVTKRPKSAKDLFSSIKTTTPKKVPVKKTPKRPVKEIVREQSSIKHNSSVTDRIKATHQSGRVSNANRERGIENAYIARVRSRMKNWSGVGKKGERVSIRLIIYNSGKFKYTISSHVSGATKNSLERFLKTQNSIGLGHHTKSTPYDIPINFNLH